MGDRLLWALLAALAMLLTTDRAEGGVSIDFPFRDQELLKPGQRDSGRAFVPENVPVGSPVPVVVFLHGTNGSGPTHRWMGGAGDLRPAFESWIGQGSVAPAVLVGPSQTAHASAGRSLWPRLEWEPLVEAAAAALGGRASIDRSRVIVVGHSGAGCNPTGGLLSIAGRDNLPRAIVAIDTCLDEDVGQKLRRALPEASIGVFYQAQFWPRDVEGFLAGINRGAWSTDALRTEEVAGDGSDPHNDIVPDGLHQALRWLLPAVSYQ